MTFTVFVPVMEGADNIELSVVSEVLTRADYRIFLLPIIPQKECAMAYSLVYHFEKTMDEFISEEFNGSITDFVKIIDAIVLVGGAKAANEMRDCDILIKILRESRRELKLIAAIDAASPIVLGYHGLFRDGSQVTCNPELQEMLKNMYKSVHVKIYDNICYDPLSNVLTSQSPSTAIPFALCLVCILSGEKIAVKLHDDLCAHCIDEIHGVNHGTEGQRIVDIGIMSVERKNKAYSLQCAPTFAEKIKPQLPSSVEDLKR